MGVTSKATLLSVTGTNSTGTAIQTRARQMSFQIALTGSTATAVVSIQGSLDGGSSYGVLSSATYTGGATPSLVNVAGPYEYVKGVISAIGTTTTVVTVTGYFIN